MVEDRHRNLLREAEQILRLRQRVETLQEDVEVSSGESRSQGYGFISQLPKAKRSFMIILITEKDTKASGLRRMLASVISTRLFHNSTTIQIRRQHNLKVFLRGSFGGLKTSQEQRYLQITRHYFNLAP